MKATLAALAIAMMPLPAAALDSLPDVGTPVSCCDPDTLWDLLAAEDDHDAVLVGELMHSRCRPLAGARYLLEERRNGVSRLRVFPVANDWSRSWIAYTLDEMVDPALELPLPEPSRVPTGWAPALGAPPVV